MDECKNRAAGSLEWKEGEGERERFEKWKVKQNPHGYTSGHPWWFESGLQKAYGARQPEIDALKAENEKLRKDSERYQYLRNKAVTSFVWDWESECGVLKDAKTAPP
jgi:hypothetical protein